MFSLNSHVKTLLDEYVKKFPSEVGRYDLLTRQLNESDDLSTRKNFKGHLTASAYILSHTREQIALIHNINLNKWLAPGGHWEEGDNEMYNNAKREATEETGIQNIELFHWHADNNFIPIDLDTHYIPENSKKQEKEHFHHDFRYIFTLNDIKADVQIQIEEITGLKWVPIGESLENFSGNNVIKKILEVK